MNTKQVHDEWLGHVQYGKNGQKSIGIWRSVPEMDAQIRKMYYPHKEQDFYIVEVGLFESIGEQGEILTMMFDEEPLITEMIDHLKLELIEKKEDLIDTIRSGREDRYMEILERLKL